MLLAAATAAAAASFSTVSLEKSRLDYYSQKGQCVLANQLQFLLMTFQTVPTLFYNVKVAECYIGVSGILGSLGYYCYSFVFHFKKSLLTSVCNGTFYK